MRTYRAQKAALTRAINSKDLFKIRAECILAVREWDEGWIVGLRPGAWPDDWHRWNIAYDDTFGPLERHLGLGDV